MLFRSIFELLPGSQSDQIQGTLRIVRLSESQTPEYEAVSYVWRAEYSQSNIYILESERKMIRQVPPALDGILRSLRHPAKARHLWIDAICINIMDFKERNLVLPQIPLIFECAQNVCIWLGNPSNDSELAFDFIHNTLMDLPKFYQTVTDSTYLPHWTALFSLISRAWFSRRWIVQEIVCARTATVHCGPLVVRWDDLTYAVELFRKAAEIWQNDSRAMYLVQYQLIQNVSELPVASLLDFCETGFERNSRGLLRRRLSLAEIVTSMVEPRASLPHDCIYAYLGLAADLNVDGWRKPPPKLLLDSPGATPAPREGTGNALLRPDYTKSAFEAFAEFVEFAIESSRSLDIICSPWAPEPTGTVDAPVPPSYPSWICTAYGPFKESMDGQYIRVSGDPFVGRQKPGLPKKWKYHASGHSLPTVSRHGRVLSVQGQVISRISATSDLAVHGLIPADWRTLAGWTGWGGYPPEAYYRTLVADRGQKALGAPKYFSAACYEAYHHRRPDDSLDIQSCLASTRPLPSLVIEYLRLAEGAVWGRRLIKTESQTLGLAPRKAVPGDLVCLLYGCSVPVILHRCENGNDAESYELVGDCYLDGFMRGEALPDVSDDVQALSQTFHLN